MKRDEEEGDLVQRTGALGCDADRSRLRAEDGGRARRGFPWSARLRLRLRLRTGRDNP